jgi:hypothetical protein
MRDARNKDKPITGGNFTFLSDMNSHQTNNGLTKREYAAIAAMQGIIANTGKILTDHESVSILAVEYADALFEELDKGEEK